MQDLAYIGYNDKTKNIGLVPVVLVAKVLISAIPYVINSINRGKPNPNDWMGWNALDGEKGYPIGTNAISWIINDGQSIQNEALNILQYIQNYGYDNVLTYNSYYQRTITANDLANKLRRGGYINEANQLLTPSTPVQSVTNVLSNNKNLLLYGGIALAILLIIKK
jgi:hypothetical protein